MKQLKTKIKISKISVKLFRMSLSIINLDRLFLL